MNWNNDYPPGNGYPQQQPQQPQQGYGQPHGMFPNQGQGNPYGQPQQASQQPVGLPADFQLPDDQLIAQAQAKAQAEAQRVADIRAGRFGGSGAKFWKPPGPNGANFSQAHVGYEHREVIWILPLVGDLGEPFVERKTLFWKNQRNPQGESIGANDIVKASRKILYNSANPEDHKYADAHGKVGTKFLCHIIRLDYYQEHFDENGVMHPFIWECPSQTHADILRIFKEKQGASRCMDPNGGVPLVVRKEKIRADQMGVKWSVMPGDPMPLPQHFWPAIHNRVDLNKFVKRPTAQEIYTFLVDNGMPINAEIQGMLQQWAAQDTQVQAQQSQVVVGGQQQFQNAAPQPSYQANHAPPQPSPYGQPPQMQQPIQLIKGQIQQPLPDGRERCFGSFNPQYQICQLCPDWIKQQCIPQSAHNAQPSGPNQGLTSLKNQIGG